MVRESYNGVIDACQTSEELSSSSVQPGASASRVTWTEPPSCGLDHLPRTGPPFPGLDHLADDPSLSAGSADLAVGFVSCDVTVMM